MIRKIGNWITTVFKPNLDTKIILLGMDAAGKTTILYKLKLGEIVAIPTIGMNIETVEYKRIKMTCWDVGGCDRTKHLWRQYTENLDAIVYVVDTACPEIIEEAAKELTVFIEECGSQIPILFFANKRDLKDCITLEELETKMMIKEQNLTTYHIQPSKATQGEGLNEGFEWLYQIISKKKGFQINNDTAKEKEKEKEKENDKEKDKEKGDRNSHSNPAGPPPPQPPYLSPSDELTNNQFLSSFENFTLPCWDHKTHIRIAYLNLKRYGRKEGVQKIRQGIQNFIANSQITNKNRYHETMTYFWIQMTHHALFNSNIPLTWEPYDDVNGLAEFDNFLEKNTQLMNGGLFLQYYTKDLMLMKMESRQQFVAPDIKPLPSIINT